MLTIHTANVVDYAGRQVFVHQQPASSIVNRIYLIITNTSAKETMLKSSLAVFCLGLEEEDLPQQSIVAKVYLLKVFVQ